MTHSLKVRRFKSIIAIAMTLAVTPLLASSVLASAATPTTSAAATRMTPLGNSWR